MRTSHITQYLTSMAGLICLAIYLCVLAPYTSPLYASESIRREARFDVAFPINSFKVERDFGTNAAVLDSLAELITAVRDESTYIELKEIGLNGTASPDGRLTSNLRLADRRMRSLRDYIVANYDIPNSVIILKEAAKAPMIHGLTPAYEWIASKRSTAEPSGVGLRVTYFRSFVVRLS